MDNDKLYKWSDIALEYPDKWAIITDIKEKDGMIETCKLISICTQDEKAELIKKYKKQGLKFECERTTFSAPNVGVVC
jgi:hypothetical protein